jgi:hypothetical protein
MVKKAVLVVLMLVGSVLWAGAAPSRATGESWTLIDVATVGCQISEYTVDSRFAGLDSGEYWIHTQTFSDGKAYGNEGYSEAGFITDGDQDPWHVANDFSYGALANEALWPMAPGKPMKAVFMLERPKGTVLSSWTIVAASCDSPTLLYIGPTAADVDGDYVKVPTDKCPTLRAFTTNGCPLRARTLTLKAKYGPRRVVGRLYASGYPALYAGRTVVIWRKQPGPDKKLATRTTNSLGKFKLKVAMGRYYATSAALLVPTAGQVGAARSTTVRVH